jgi:predicted alpha-1,6-mannanase (GH76 family)
MYRSGGRQVFDRLKLERVAGLKRPAYQWTRGRVPGASTGPASSITENSATVSATVNSKERSSSYDFQYGTTTSYGSTTASQAAGSGPAAVNASASLGGLVTGTTYHYRIRAFSAAGVAYGSDRTFTTVITPQQSDANRAVATYEAMQSYFSAASVYLGDTSGLYTNNYPQSGTHYSGIWPFSQALAGMITLAGIPSSLVGGISYQADVAGGLTGLSRYFDSTSSPPGYDSHPTGQYGGGGDKYYDDQAWVGLATAEYYAMTGDPTSLSDAENVFNFVYPGGWASGASFEPGGIYWVQQGVGNGLSNHDRTATSNAPNAELAALLATLDPSNAAAYQAGANAIYAWVNHDLYNVGTNLTDPEAPNPNFTPNQPGLMFDRLTGADTVVQTLYTYNQGAMIAANVREYQATGDPAYLADAEAIAIASLSTFNEDYYINHSAAFNAIFFRGLLVLYSVTSNTSLQANIIQTIQTYADDAWNNHRGSDGLFSFASTSGAGDQLIDQGAMLRIFAMLAWNPSDYGELP